MTGAVAVTKLEAVSLFRDACRDRERVECLAGAARLSFHFEEVTDARIVLSPAQAVLKARLSVGTLGFFEYKAANQVVHFASRVEEVSAERGRAAIAFPAKIERRAESLIAKWTPPPETVAITLGDGKEMPIIAAVIQDFSLRGVTFSCRELFQKGEEAPLSITAFARRVQCRARVEVVFGEGEEAGTASGGTWFNYQCRLCGMKIEDVRFLVEKVAGRAVSEDDLALAE